MRSALTLLLALLCIGLATCTVNTNGSFTYNTPNNNAYYSNRSCYHKFRAQRISQKLSESTDFQLNTVTFISAVRSNINNICNEGANLNFAEESAGDGYSSELQPTEEEHKVMTFWNKFIWGHEVVTRDGGVAERLRQKRSSAMNNLLEMTNYPTNDLDCTPACYSYYPERIANFSESIESIYNRSLNLYDVQSMIIHALTVIYDYNTGVTCNNGSLCWTTKQNLVSICRNEIKAYWGANSSTFNNTSFGNPDDTNKRSQFIIDMNSVWAAQDDISVYASC